MIHAEYYVFIVGKQTPINYTHNSYAVTSHYARDVGQQSAITCSEVNFWLC